MSENKDKLPNLIIIGSMKSGTTSLHHYLDSHPQISLSDPKELHFFIKEKNWEKGLAWYQSHFDSKALIRGETSPSYTAYPKWQGVPERMHSVVPNAKLIYILRDPIERMISHYLNRYANSAENREINQALADFNQDYVIRSHYYFQLQKYLNYYPSSSILILTTEELSQSPQKTLQTVFNFLGVSDNSESVNYQDRLHKSADKRRRTSFGRYITKLPIIKKINELPIPLKASASKIFYSSFSKPLKKPKLNQDLRDQLIKHLKNDINQLRDYTGRDFQEWCV